MCLALFKSECVNDMGGEERILNWELLKENNIPNVNIEFKVLRALVHLFDRKYCCLLDY